MNIFRLFFAIGLSATPAAAQDFTFYMMATDECLASAGFDGAAACFGRSAAQCMAENEGGESTVGTGACLSYEYREWDRRLNNYYQAAILKARQADREAADYITENLRQEPALREMQRAWIPFRDRKCDHVATLWGGGSGTGPAVTDCLLKETGAQALYILEMMQGY